MSNCLLINNIVKTELIGQSTDFSYTGNVQSFTVPTTGIYKLEVWGAQGGGVSGDFPDNQTSYSGGKGAYVVGYKVLNAGDTLYVCIGSKPSNVTKNDIWDYNWSKGGGYNCGGSGGGRVAAADDPPDLMYRAMGAGGGATHMALNSNRGVLSNYSSNANELLVVAGGGSGAYKHFYDSTHVSGRGNGNDSGGGGGSFGQGSSWSDSILRGGGGGGYAGGSAGNGGSDYISGVPEVKYGGIVYSPSITDGNNSGNGKAKITFYAIAKNLNRAIVAGE